MRFDRVAGFMAQLAEKDGIDAKAMRFTILTAVRTSEAIGRPPGENSTSNALSGAFLPSV